MKLHFLVKNINLQLLLCDFIEKQDNYDKVITGQLLERVSVLTLRRTG